MTQIKLSGVIAPSFFKVHQDVKRHDYTHYVLAGGRGSTKSSYISLEILLLLMKNPNCHAVILRKVGNTLRNSVFSQMEWALDTLHMRNCFKITVSPPTITRKSTGQKILFFGVDDKAKIKSIKLPFGYIGVVWYEELDQFSGMEEIRNLNQSLLRGGSKFWCFSSYNPPKSAQNWVNEEMMYDDADRLIHKSTYLDVNPVWLGEQFIEEAEKLKRKNETAYRHEYLGEITGTGGSVFENVKEITLTNEDINSFDYIYYGLDFGFAIDPLAFVCMHYDKKHENLYIFDEIYQTKLTNWQASEKIKRKVSETAIIRADSSEPKSIKELNELGLYVLGVKKYPDSVSYGIRWLQSLNNIYIDKKRCPNAFKEFMTYEYEKTKDGQFISAYPDKNNHAIDSVRYGCESVMPTRYKVKTKRSNLY
ncbi:PBSX family phage terminase large subunit [Dialister micraerophilus]|uniref:PBSX family phage terminase large subunit n=1 Tax=Dialister micraerophilus TaxID=309120 RepID=UPI0023F2B724|nr:PBSX family phage terminase large subunit [Dialister micraerophilus]